MIPASPLLEVEDLVVQFPPRRGGNAVSAVDGLSLTLARGETLGLVGESGCGKSTLARAILRLVEPTSGTVAFDGHDVLSMGRRALHDYRRSAQIVFQDPTGSLNPRMAVGESIAQPLRIHRRYGRDGRRRVTQLLDMVGLPADFARRHPAEMSGGQRQRVGIARALALEPRLLVLDEPVSSLDASVQAQVLDLLAELRARLGLTYLFISHDLAVVHHLAPRVAVMYLGQIVEIGPADAVYARPQHPYTAALLSAVPVPDPRGRDRRARIVVQGEPPDPAAPPPGCRFHPRCWRADERCAVEVPVPAEDGTWYTCHHPCGHDARIQ